MIRLAKFHRNIQRQSFCSIVREKLECDVLIVGAGPAGLSTAIKLKQLAIQQGNYDPSVIVIEKSSQIGGHILSGNCFQPDALNELFPNWNSFTENRPPVDTKVSQDHFYVFLNDKKSIQIPHFLYPKTIRNHGNYVISLGDLCVWLGQKAQEAGVDIFTGTSGAEIIYSEDGSSVAGIQTGDMGINKKGEQKETYAPGIQILAKQTVFAEGARGSLSQQVIKKFNLNEGKDPQTYGIGLKEVWEVDDSVFIPGLVQHSVGWPLDIHTYGGSFMYHIGKNQVHIGMVVGLDYKNPSINPYEEFQQLKTHPIIEKTLQKGNCISYGARSLNEGGFFAIPKLTFPGGMLVGCSAGFLNVMKIKGSHNAMKSGIVAAETIYQNLQNSHTNTNEFTQYEQNLKKTWVYKELYESRNFKGSFKFNIYSGLIYGAFQSFISKGREPIDIRIQKKDSEHYIKYKELQPDQIKTYPKHDGKLTFDILDNLQKSGTYHDHDQPAHLKIKKNQENDPRISLEVYGAPEERFCPAKVYEHIDDGEGGKKLQINAQNCLHCKTCDIKMPKDYIRWTVPEGNGGPNYSGM